MHLSNVVGVDDHVDCISKCIVSVSVCIYVLYVYLCIYVYVFELPSD
jgi:hypothetical protein